jgi:hypothetical protein
MLSCCMSNLKTLLLLFAVYVLSYGPVHALYASHRIEGTFGSGLTTFYQPLHWLHQHTPLDKPMTSYADWWQGVLKK